jgi:hypothetical protein
MPTKRPPLRALLTRLLQGQERVLKSNEEVLEEMRRGIYGTPIHLIPVAERQKHLAHPTCPCLPVRRDRHDGPTLWTHRLAN